MTYRLQWRLQKMSFDFWRVDATALQAVKADGTGQQFTRFLNSLISSEAFFSNLAPSEVHLNLQINLHDGGADAAVSLALPHDQSGWMQSPTVWQYKRSRLSEKELVEEINKPSVLEYIQKGHSYRLCVCDEEAPPDAEKKSGILAEAQRAIRTDVPPPHLLTASSLANWVNRFPALVLGYFYPGTASKFFDLYTWKQNITAATRQFVPMEQWKTTFDDIQSYVDFKQPPPVPPFLLKGEAGTGKTRLCYESLAAMPGADGQVIYCSDNQQSCAAYLAMYRDVRAILVADECDAVLRQKLQSAVRGFQDRIRVIAINAESPSHSGAREHFLKQLGASEVEEVLKRNFPEVPEESRRRYADLCGGFIGLAADMCTYHPQIAASGDLAPAMQSVEDYYRHRLPDNERRHVEAIALLSRVGFKRDEEKELLSLCTFCGLTSSEVKQTADRVHNSPGFVGVGGTYLYVRPKIIARVAFGEAWHRWANSDPDTFLSTFPPSLLDQFLERVNKSATEEVRLRTAQFFRTWAARLQPGSLTDGEVVERLCNLTETMPDEFLPRLRWLVEEANAEQLFGVKGNWIRQWGPRRTIVWLCERLAAFPEYFADVESILLRLALAESEPQISNNATHIWEQMFRIYLSGTALPFAERFARLRKYIHSQDVQVSKLAVSALGNLLDPFGSRTGGPFVVAGRIPPDEWVPSPKQAHEAVFEILNFLAEMTHSQDASLARAATNIALEHMYNLLVRGYQEKLEDVLDPKVADDETRARIVGGIDHFLHLQSDYAPAQFKLSPSQLETVTLWKKSLELTDLRGRMLTALSTNDWGFSGNRRDEWLKEIKDLASAFFANPDSLLKEFRWLYSDAAKAAVIFGEHVGLLDREGRLLPEVMKSVLEYHDSGFARGYIYGLLSHNGNQIERVNKLLDSVQQESAQLAYELFIVGGAKTHAFGRTLALARGGKLSVRHFRNLGVGASGDDLSADNIVAVLEFLLHKADAGEPGAIETAIGILAFHCLHRQPRPSSGFDNETIRALAWSVVEGASQNAGTESFWWSKLLESLLPYDAPRAATAAANGMLGKGLNQQDDSARVLLAIADAQPNVAMDAIGTAAMDEKRGWRFLVGRYDVIKALPTQTVISWIDKQGVEGARRIARQLPAPFLSSEGVPTVPRLTEYVIQKFGEDKQVFNEFVAGVHNLQSYMGDIAGQKQNEADIARKFLNYPLRRIQQWAQIEIMDAEAQAEFWKEFEASQDIDH
jgi:hypothetical protein